MLSDKLLPKLLRCIREGFSEKNIIKTNRIIAAFKALLLGNQVYLYPHPNGEYLSILLQSLDIIYSGCSSIDEDKLSASLQLLCSLYKNVNLSSI